MNMIFTAISWYRKASLHLFAVGEMKDVNTNPGITEVIKDPKEWLFLDPRPCSPYKVMGAVSAAEVSQIRGCFSSMSNKV